MVETLEKLFQENIKDLYSAEKQFLAGMKKLSKKAESQELKQALDQHIEQTEEHVKRIEQVAEICGTKPSGKACKAAQGLVEEAVEHLEEVEQGPVLDAAIVECAQKNEHYEICSYGTLIAWAAQLGLDKAIPILQKTLDEEKQADELLSKVAEQSVNTQAQSNESETSKPKATVR